MLESLHYADDTELTAFPANRAKQKNSACQIVLLSQMLMLLRSEINILNQLQHIIELLLAA